MSAFIKQLRECYKRWYGYDPALEPWRKPPAGPKQSLAEFLKEHPLMTLDVPFEEQNVPDRDKH